MEVYQIRENFIESDTDGWQHWIESSPLTMHSTVENAQKQIQKLLNELINSIPANRALNPHIEESYYVTKELNYKNNYFGKDEWGNDEPVYYVSRIELVD